MSPKNFAFFFLLVLLFASCTKDKPRRGLYWGEFYTVDSIGAAISRYDNSIQVTDPTASSVSINGSSLEKSGNTLKGTMGYTPAFPAAQSIILDAKWKNKNGNYKIEGEFSVIGAVNYFGTFRMGSY